MLEHLDAEPGRYDLSSVAVDLVVGRDVEPRQQARAAAAHARRRCCSTRSARRRRSGWAASVSAAGVAEQTAKFALTENNAVFTEDGRRVEPGRGRSGMVAVGGFIPVGYYKDEAKTAATFRTFEGRRWSIPGDFATVNADGTHPPARPRLGVHQHRRREGVPRGGRGGAEDAPGGPRRGRRRRARRAVRRDDLRGRRAGRRRGRRRRRAAAPTSAASSPAYKAPRNVVVVDTIGRAANGKVDYTRLKARPPSGSAQPTRDAAGRLPRRRVHQRHPPLAAGEQRRRTSAGGGARPGPGARRAVRRRHRRSRGGRRRAGGAVRRRVRVLVDVRAPTARGRRSCRRSGRVLREAAGRRRSPLADAMIDTVAAGRRGQPGRVDAAQPRPRTCWLRHLLADERAGR